MLDTVVLLPFGCLLGTGKHKTAAINCIRVPSGSSTLTLMPSRGCNIAKQGLTITKRFWFLQRLIHSCFSDALIVTAYRLLCVELPLICMHIIHPPFSQCSGVAVLQLHMCCTISMSAYCTHGTLHLACSIRQHHHPFDCFVP